MGEGCPNLLDLIPREREWVVSNRKDEEKRHGCSSDESKKLELRLGLPGDHEGWSIQKIKNNPVRERVESQAQLLSLKYFSPSKHTQEKKHAAGFPNSNPWPCSGYKLQAKQQQKQQQNCASPYVHHPPQYQTGPNESSQPCCTRIVDLQNSEMKAFSPASANTAVPNSSQKRAAPAAVVGWPPVRSFRKNLASTSSSKPVSEPQSSIPSKPLNEKPAAENSNKGLFVKINMDGVAIGRKVDLNAYGSYEKLSSSIDELFRGLLAAQRDSSAGGNEKKQEEQKPITDRKSVV